MVFALTADGRIQSGKPHNLPRLWPSISTSIVLHGIVLSAILLFPAASAILEPSEQDSISVEIVAPQKTESVRKGTAIAKKVLPTTVETSSGRVLHKENSALPTAAKVEKEEAHKSALIAAAKLYAATVLGAPKSRKMRAALRKLGPQEKMIQLCDIEAMEQIARLNLHYQPEYVIAYAMADLTLSTTSVDAPGAAFRSRRDWYGLQFNCVVSPDISKVLSFAFAVRDEIPKSEWPAHNLTPDDGPDDD